MMMAKKKMIDAFKSDKEAVRRMDMLMSASYLLLSINQSYIEELQDLLLDYGLCIGEMKQSIKQINSHFDRLNSNLKDMVKDENKPLLIEDFTWLDKTIREFLNQNNTKQ